MFEQSMRTLDEIIALHARARPHAPAVISARTSLSYAALDDLVRRAASMLAGAGLAARGRIALSFDDEILELVLTLAIASLGGRMVSLAVHAPPLVRGETCRAAGVGVLLCDDPRHRLAGLPAGVVTLDQIGRQPRREMASPSDADLAADFILVSSSGSTGAPKRFHLSQEILLRRLRQRVSFFRLDPRDRFLRVSSFSYIGSKVRHLSALLAGAAAVFPEDRLHGVWKACVDHQVSFLSAVVVQVEQLIRQKLHSGTMPRLDLRVLEISASSVGDDLRRRARQVLSPNVYVTYSTNESGAIAIATPDEVRDRPGTVGRPLEGVEVRVVDPVSGASVTGRPGLIRVRSDQTIDAYWNDPANTARHFRNGDFLPGDVGLLSASGELTWLGRADDMMIMNGINIHPSAITECLLRHPSVTDAAAFPLRHRVHGDVPVCAVSVRESPPTSEAMLLKYASARLGAAGPRRIVILDAIPRNELGKVDRMRLVGLAKDRLEA
jgi:acyl-CoA synthetase (AMP-forming)/AMP-acid ligase II